MPWSATLTLAPSGAVPRDAETITLVLSGL